MSRVRPLSPYMQQNEERKQQNANLLKYAVAKKNPEHMGGNESPRLESMDEQTVCNSIPISKFKSSHVFKKKQMEIDVALKCGEGSEQLSPGATQALRDTNFRNIDHPSLLSAATGNHQKVGPMQYCVCGLPCASN